MYQAHLLDEPARDALRRAAAALDAAELIGRPCDMSQALLALGRAHLALRAVAGAEAYLEMALRWARLSGSTDELVSVLCELCETAACLAESAADAGKRRAARERARDHAFEASALAGHVADPGWEVKVLLRISDVLDRCGDRADAVCLQVRALRIISGVAPGTGAHDPCVLPGLGRLADT
jgi:tetratricopeptide (TPR) repeat protein